MEKINAFIGKEYIQLQRIIDKFVRYDLYKNLDEQLGLPVDNQIWDNVGSNVENNIRITNDKFK